MAEESTLSRIVWTTALAVASLAVAVLVASLVWQMVDLRGAPGIEADPPAPDDGIIQVDIRNGVGAAGLAAGLTTFLRQRGFDVVSTGNWRSFDVAETIVIDRAGNPAAAARVARSIGIGESQVVENLDERLFVDVTVVIGHDYDRLRPFTTPSP